MRGTLDDQVRAFLAYLHRGGQWGYWWTLPARASVWWPTEDPAPLPIGQGDVYFGIHPCADIPTLTTRGTRADPSEVRSRIENIAAINCLFAEYDIKLFEDSWRATGEHIRSLEHQPNVIIRSGGGYHSYWLFDEPWRLLTEEDRTRAMEMQAAWVLEVGSDPAAKDLARVLRVPGTLNYKYEPARPVQIKRMKLP